MTGGQVKKANITTPTELAKKRGVTLDYIYKQLRTGRIPAIRQGKRWLIPMPAEPV